MTVNGDPVDLPDGMTVAELAARLGVGARGSAVALDSAVLPRAEWAGTVLREGQRVEVVHAVQGG